MGIPISIRALRMSLCSSGSSCSGVKLLLREVQTAFPEDVFGNGKDISRSWAAWLSQVPAPATRVSLVHSDPNYLVWIISKLASCQRCAGARSREKTSPASHASFSIHEAWLARQRRLLVLQKWAGLWSQRAHVKNYSPAHFLHRTSPVVLPAKLR